MQAWTVSNWAVPCRLGCELELAPRTLSPRNRVSTFYLFGIQRNHPTSRSGSRPPGVQPGGTDGKAPGVQARGKDEYKIPGVQAGGKCNPT